MFAKIAADAVVLIHLGYILFVVLGGFLVLRRPKWLWLHLPAAAWGASIEFAGFFCPLSPLEQRLRIAAGQEGYTGGFIEHYLIPLIYPERFDRKTQIILGTLVVLINVAVYGTLTAKRLFNQRKRVEGGE